ncbi:helix-turn-helix domain-containing protein [Burkholderia gladioli]|uniref:helix-turn-helix domain-containing protein n=1 Tax=Burkholderia gladioli TaxID=28095 RepID=UPI003C7E04EF
MGQTPPSSLISAASDLPLRFREQVTQLQSRVAVGEKKAAIARDLGISRETLYAYLRAPAMTESAQI